jgi:hypothetical protein
MIPMAMARKIHKARNRSRIPRDLKIEDSREGRGWRSAELSLETFFSWSVVEESDIVVFGGVAVVSIVGLLDSGGEMCINRFDGNTLGILKVVSGA